MADVVILGGGPGGYEAALVAAQLGASVTVVDSGGLGGSAVLTDCVPSKALIAVAEVVTDTNEATVLGVRIPGTGDGTGITVDLGAANKRILGLAHQQSVDISAKLAKAGVLVVTGRGRLAGSPRASSGKIEVDRVVVSSDDGADQELPADVVLVSTGARPRVLPTAVPDGERILTWTQVYDMTEVPEELVVVGSGVTGAEFAGAYQSLGSQVTLISSRDRVLPGEDVDAAQVLQDVFERRGMRVMSRSRAVSVERRGASVLVQLEDGRTVTGSHCLLAVGSVPNTENIGLAEAGVTVDRGGFVTVDKVSRTGARGVYAAGDCTGVLMLASVAAMQGRIAMWHALGDAVTPLNLLTVSSNVFTDPEIATVGVTQRQVDSGEVIAVGMMLPLAGNARAKMMGVTDGFVKLFARASTRTIVGGVVVAPRASELIFPVALAIEGRLTVDQLTHAFTVYPSLSGSIAEVARQLRRAD